MMNRVVTLAAAAAMVFGFSGVAQAQGTGTTQEPTFELGAGYQLYRAGELCDDEGDVDLCDELDGSQTFPFGVAIDGVRNFGALGIVGEVGWSRDSFELPLVDEDVSTDLFHFAGGVRWTGRGNPRIWPYGQVLAGAAVTRVSNDLLDDSAADTNFMVQPGVGLTFVAGDGWGIFGQVDYRRIFLDEDETGFSGRNDVRVFIGARMILD